MKLGNDDSWRAILRSRNITKAERMRWCSGRNWSHRHAIEPVLYNISRKALLSRHLALCGVNSTNHPARGARYELSRPRCGSVVACTLLMPRVFMSASMVNDQRQFGYWPWRSQRRNRSWAWKLSKAHQEIRGLPVKITPLLAKRAGKLWNMWPVSQKRRNVPMHLATIIKINTGACTERGPIDGELRGYGEIFRRRSKFSAGMKGSRAGRSGHPMHIVCRKHASFA